MPERPNWQPVLYCGIPDEEGEVVASHPPVELQTIADGDGTFTWRRSTEEGDAEFSHGYATMDDAVKAAEEWFAEQAPTAPSTPGTADTNSAAAE